MNCKNCGSQINIGDMFCKNCGTNINQNNNSQNVNNEMFIDAYIGSQADKIKREKFSICTLLFGQFYFLYKKMYLYAFVWAIVISRIPLDSIYINIISNFIMAFVFKNLYLYQVNNKVKSIISKNNGKSTSELIEICKKKGGSTFTPIIIVSVLIFLIYGSIYVARDYFYDNINCSTNDGKSVTAYIDDKKVVSYKADGIKIDIDLINSKSDLLETDDEFMNYVKYAIEYSTGATCTINKND